MRHCQAAACMRQASGYSRFCVRHATRNRRHGHHEQLGITLERLKPSLEQLRSYIARHGGEALWTKLEAAWATVVRDASGTLADAQSGRPFFRHEAAAAGEIVRVAESASARVIIETVAAMGMLLHQEPGAFRSDNAARVQTARRFRGLSAVTKRRYSGASDGKRKTVSLGMRLDVSATLGRMLLESLGVLGPRIADGIAAEHQRRAIAWQDAYAALRPNEAA